MLQEFSGLVLLEQVVDRLLVLPRNEERLFLLVLFLVFGRRRSLLLQVLGKVDFPPLSLTRPKGLAHLLRRLLLGIHLQFLLSLSLLVIMALDVLAKTLSLGFFPLLQQTNEAAISLEPILVVGKQDVPLLLLGLDHVHGLKKGSLFQELITGLRVLLSFALNFGLMGNFLRDEGLSLSSLFLPNVDVDVQVLDFELLALGIPFLGSDQSRSLALKGLVELLEVVSYQGFKFFLFELMPLIPQLLRALFFPFEALGRLFVEPTEGLCFLI